MPEHNGSTVMDAPRMTIPAAAARLKLNPKRLRGLVWLGTLGKLDKPIGSVVTDEIYLHEVERLERQRPPSDSTAVTTEKA